jgi:predicted transcriptional regulator
MAKYKQNPRYNVVSIRVSDQERENLEEMARETNKKVSELMREALRTMALPADINLIEQVKGESSI